MLKKVNRTRFVKNTINRFENGYLEDWGMWFYSRKYEGQGYARKTIIYNKHDITLSCENKTIHLLVHCKGKYWKTNFDISFVDKGFLNFPAVWREVDEFVEQTCKEAVQ